MNVNAKNNPTEKMRYIVLTGLFSALIFIFTACLHIPSGSGFTHAGDGILYLAACILPAPYAVTAGIIGGTLADGLSGFPVWIPATIAVKALTALFFTNKSAKILTFRNICGIVPSLAVCIAGYTLYEGTVLAKGFSVSSIIAAAAQIPSYCVQILASTILFVITAAALDKADFRHKFRL